MKYQATYKTVGVAAKVVATSLLTLALHACSGAEGAGSITVDEKVDLGACTSGMTITTVNPATALTTCTIPSGLTSITVTACGAEGGDVNTDDQGGNGASVSRAIMVQAGDVLGFAIGGRGADRNGRTGGAGGINGGGSGGTDQRNGNNRVGGAGGGGWTGVFLNPANFGSLSAAAGASSRQIIAAGGGGASNGDDGAAAGADGGNDNDDAQAGGNGSGGSGGNSNNGDGSNGGSGQGGAGATTDESSGGGGGGGGRYGGGGGQASGPGAGGSSVGAAFIGSPTTSDCGNSGNGKITLSTFTLPTATPTATATPTPTPTPTPTVAPTATPTATPAVTPCPNGGTPPSCISIVVPTQCPNGGLPPTCIVIVIPTPTPTPTATPTQDPCLVAKAGGGKIAVQCPTATPTPTMVPTATPTPTVEPTATPTPTVEPTATPTPTVEPTATPTPTAEPTATPTPTPTIEPTATPTPTPTQDPCLALKGGLGKLSCPSASPSPTATPTQDPCLVTKGGSGKLLICPPSPTPSPTSTATATPTALPTSAPTTVPTTVPTATPVATPTPTVVPTAGPTATPTPVATATPTGTPTASPTASPTPTPDSDVDDDGVMRSVESQVPNPEGSGKGDGNGDGTPDANQTFVTSLKTFDEDSYFTVVSVGERQLSVVTAVDVPADFPANTIAPFSGVSFTALGVTPGTVETFELHMPFDPEINGLLKKNRLTGEWDNVAVALNNVGTKKTIVTFALEDGGPYDVDGVANGVIVDPSLPAIMKPKTVSGSGGGAFGALMIGLLAGLAALRRRLPVASALCVFALVGVTMAWTAPLLAAESRSPWTVVFSSGGTISDINSRGDLQRVLEPAGGDLQVTEWDKHPKQYSLRVGYDLTPNFGIEVGAEDLGDYDFAFTAIDPDEARLQQLIEDEYPSVGFGATVAATAQVELSNWMLKVRGGYFAGLSNDVDYTIDGESFSIDAKDNSWLFGASAQYGLDQHLSIGLDYQLFDLNANVQTLGIILTYRI